MENKIFMVKKNFDRVLLDNIDLEEKFESFVYNVEDRKTVSLMLKEINTIHKTEYFYLSELLFEKAIAIGDIILKYIWEIKSVSTKAYLVPLILVDKKIKNKDSIFLELYKEFKNSNEYISLPGCPSPAHIYVRYDNAFSSISIKNVVDEIVLLLSCPRDAFYLPLTLQKLSKAKNKDVYQLLCKYSSANNLCAEDFNLPVYSNGLYYPSYEYMKNQLVSISNMFLKHYK